MKIKIPAAILMMVMLSGCIHQLQRPFQSDDAGQPLQDWIKADLAPYLVDRLSEHPRFRDEPVLVVKLNGADVQADIDELTEGIRQEIRDALLDTPGITLPWRPGRKPSHHHRKLSAVDCRGIREANYYVGIETRRLPDGRHGVSVRALDIEGKEWVSGFGMSWQGQLTAAETESLKHSRLDEALRGLRVLPFNKGQTDLAADYLANNLSCLLRQQEQADGLMLYVDSQGAEDPSLPKLMELIGNNLSRYQEVGVTGNESEASLVLRGRIYPLQPDLQQVWIRLNPSQSGVHLAGMDTAAYFTMQTPDKHRISDSKDRKPLIARMALRKAPSTPGRGGRCPEGAADCHSLAVTTRNADQLFVIAHRPEAGVSLIYPGGCSSDSVERPAAKEKAYSLSTGAESGESTFYAIVVNGEQLGKRLGRHLSLLPEACVPGIGGLPHAEGLNDWLSGLDNLIADYPGQIAWAVQRGDR